MAPTFWEKFVELFRNSTPQEVDPQPSAQDGDQSAQGGELSVRGDPAPSEFLSILRMFEEDQLLVAGIPKPASLVDVALMNTTVAMRLLLAKFKQYANWVKDNPRQATLIAACIIIPIVFTAATPAILGAIGFSAAGPVAGSLAAAIQAHIGIVGAGSLFAIVQSAAMAGYGLPIVLGTVWGGTTLICWGARALWNKFMKKSKDGDEDGDEDGDAPESMAVARWIGNNA